MLLELAVLAGRRDEPFTGMSTEGNQAPWAPHCMAQVRPLQAVPGFHLFCLVCGTTQAVDLYGFNQKD